MSELWCVIESTGNNTVFVPNFFLSRDTAVKFIKMQAELSYKCSCGLRETNIEIHCDNEVAPWAHVWGHGFMDAFYAYEVSGRMENLERFEVKEEQHETD